MPNTGDFVEVRTESNQNFNSGQLQTESGGETVAVVVKDGHESERLSVDAEKVVTVSDTTPLHTVAQRNYPIDGFAFTAEISFHNEEPRDLANWESDGLVCPEPPYS